MAFFHSVSLSDADIGFFPQDAEKELMQRLCKEIRDINLKLENLEQRLDNIQNKVDSNSSHNSQNLSIKSETNLSQDKIIFERALGFMHNQNYKDAETEFNKLSVRTSDKELQSKSLYFLGEINYRQKEYENAIYQYLKSYKALPDGPKSSESLLKMSICLGYNGSINEACDMLKKLQLSDLKKSGTLNKRVKELSEQYNCK